MAVQTPWSVSTTRLHRSEVGVVPVGAIDRKRPHQARHRADRGDRGFRALSR